MYTRDNPIYLTYKRSEIEINVFDDQQGMWKATYRVNGTEIVHTLSGQFGQRMDAIAASYRCAKDAINEKRI